MHDDLVDRQFTATAPNKVWLTDITEHPAAEGKFYLCAVLDQTWLTYVETYPAETAATWRTYSRGRSLVRHRRRRLTNRVLTDNSMALQERNHCRQAIAEIATQRRFTDSCRPQPN
ncbi:Transposase [Modestobacter italicus]|uniref:Transposase n=1 Tax=Modestobacter italicus (strain DSM 44449 / CECT 9708 / BC 501) TaxID=2732864 RepID=I4F0K3_MODI5|nr:Transposase [Modestobacter marinus]